MMEGKVVNCSSVGLDRTKFKKRCLQATEPFNWKGTQESSQCVPTEAILFEKKSGFSFLRFISIFQTCSSSDETRSPIAVRHYLKKRIAISSACIESSHYKWLCTACSKYLSDT